MFLQIPHDPEHLAASGTAEGLLSSVKPQVCFQIVSQTEALAALRAGVRPLPRVESQVAAEALPQRERLGARRTRVWFFSGVKALVPPENLPPLERLPANAASVSIAGVCDHLLKPPNAVSTGGEAAEAVACVETLVAAEVSGQRPASFVVSVIVLKLHLRLRHCEHVHQLYRTGTHQLSVWRRQFQFHVEIVLSLLWRVDPFPNPNLSRSHGSIRRGRTVGFSLSGTDAGRLRLGLDGLLCAVGFGGWRLRLEDQRANKLDLLPRNEITCVWLDHERLRFSWRALQRSIS